MGPGRGSRGAGGSRRLAGGREAQTWGDQADRNPPVLHTHSQEGVRIDEVDFHPAWHKLLDVAVSNGLTAEPWTAPTRTGAHVRRAAGFVAWSQVDAGHGCPVSMTYAAVPALRSSPELSAIWTPLLASRAPAYVSEAFVASRLGGAHGHAFGTLGADLVGSAAGGVIERSFPA